MPEAFGTIYLFAGPGGLGEGFAALDIDGNTPFRIGISIGKEASAHRTLPLRAFLRDFGKSHGALAAVFVDFHAGLTAEPDWSVVDPQAWRRAAEAARFLELGTTGPVVGAGRENSGSL